MNKSLARFGSGQSLQTTDYTTLDLSDEFKRSMENVRESKEKFEQVRSLILSAIDPRQPNMKYKLARLVQAMIPKSLYPMMSEGMTRLLSENINPLEKISTLFRINLNTLQESAGVAISEVKKSRDGLSKLIKDIETAEEEKWNVKKLQHYVAARNKIIIRKEISDILDEELGLLSKEDLEAQRQETLLTLKSDEINIQEQIKLLMLISSALVRVFNQGNLEFHSYESVHRQASVARDAIQNMASLNNSMIVGREAFLKTVEVSAEVLEEILNTFDQAANHRIASADTRLRLQTAQARIEGKIHQLRTTVREKNNEMILEGEFEEVGPPLEISA